MCNMMEDSFFSKKILIGGRGVGKDQPVFIVAEAGVAHFGKIEKAFRLVDMAADAGADAVKFQIFRTENLICSEAADWRARFASKELPFEAFGEIMRYCAQKDIVFFATAHDEESLVFLDQLNPPLYKIGSGELQNWPFIRSIAEKARPVIVSTGMYDLEDVQQVVDIFEEVNNPFLMLLHCVTSYPTSPVDVNLLAIPAISRRFGAVTGYSDHTKGIHFPLAAVALGAKIIEKHISLDFNVPDAQDWKVSCDRDFLVQLVKDIREIEAGIGDGEKRPQVSESKSVEWARKSIVSKMHIFPAQMITASMLQFKRPGTGIPPSEIEQIVGRCAKVHINPDTIIKESMLK